jgi:hypothetical protein
MGSRLKVQTSHSCLFASMSDVASLGTWLKSPTPRSLRAPVKNPSVPIRVIRGQMNPGSGFRCPTARPSNDNPEPAFSLLTEYFQR